MKKLLEPKRKPTQTNSRISKTYYLQRSLTAIYGIYTCLYFSHTIRLSLARLEYQEKQKAFLQSIVDDDDDILDVQVTKRPRDNSPDDNNKRMKTQVMTSDTTLEDILPSKPSEEIVAKPTTQKQKTQLSKALLFGSQIMKPSQPNSQASQSTQPKPYVLEIYWR
jgi:hypothetical protein